MRYLTLACVVGNLFGVILQYYVPSDIFGISYKIWLIVHAFSVGFLFNEWMGGGND
jgi:hypothetical protein